MTSNFELKRRGIGTSASSARRRPGRRRPRALAAVTWLLLARVGDRPAARDPRSLRVFLRLAMSPRASVRRSGSLGAPARLLGSAQVRRANASRHRAPSVRVDPGAPAATRACRPLSAPRTDRRRPERRRVSRAKVFGVAGFERQFAIKRFHPEAHLVCHDRARRCRPPPARTAASEHPRIARSRPSSASRRAPRSPPSSSLVPAWTRLRPIAESPDGRRIDRARPGALARLSAGQRRAVGYAHGRGLTHPGPRRRT